VIIARSQRIDGENCQEGRRRECVVRAFRAACALATFGSGPRRLPSPAAIGTMEHIARQLRNVHGRTADRRGFCPKAERKTPRPHQPETGASTIIQEPGAAEGSKQHRKTAPASRWPSIEIAGLLGRGGFAEVFVGWDVTGEAEMAIKTRSDLSHRAPCSAISNSRSRRSDGLRHPKIFRITTSAKATASRTSRCRACRRKYGRRLEREGPAEVAGNVPLLREAARALAHAHKAGGATATSSRQHHARGRGAQRIVMDFGIAKEHVGGEGGGRQDRDDRWETPPVHESEQANGERQLTRARTNYSAAMVGYGMLTGRTPFRGRFGSADLFRGDGETGARDGRSSANVPAPVSDAMRASSRRTRPTRFESDRRFGAALALADVPRKQGVKRR